MCGEMYMCVRVCMRVRVCGVDGGCVRASVRVYVYVRYHGAGFTSCLHTSFCICRYLISLLLLQLLLVLR